MNRKIFSTVALAVLLLNTAIFATGDTRRHKAVKKARTANELVALLPASDGVATLDIKRAVNIALPRVLGANQKMLEHVNTALSKFQTKTGIDIHKFDNAAAGLAFSEAANGKIDLDPVVILRGDVNAPALLSAAKTAADGKYRQETIGSNTVYIFSAKEAVANTGNIPAQAQNLPINPIEDDLAVTASGTHTLIFGTLDRVRATLDHQTAVAPDIVGLLGTRETSVATFALRTPGGMAKFLPLENDEIGANIDSIRYMAGSMDMTTAGASFSLLARTQAAPEAKKLFETLSGLKMFGEAFLGNSKRADQQMYGRLIQNAKIAQTGNDVTLNVSIAQADIDTLVGKM